MGKLRILFIGPKHGGIGWYVEQLRYYLLRSLAVERIEWYGHSFLTFNAQELETIRDESRSINIEDFDIIHFQFGTYDAEQVILPVARERKSKDNVFVLTVHNTEWELWKKAGVPFLNSLLHQSLREVDGFLFFGVSPNKQFVERFSFVTPNKTSISLHPSTYEDYSVDYLNGDKVLEKYAIQRPFLALFGYPAKWKDYGLLLDSLVEIKKPVNFYFIGKWWKEKLQFDQKIVGNVNVRVIDAEIHRDEFYLFIKNSMFGVFPYAPYPTFQCSGIIPIFIGLGKCSVSTDVASIPEYVGNGGILVRGGDPVSFGQAMNRIISDSTIKNILETNAIKMASRITWNEHIGCHLNFYNRLLVNRRTDPGSHSLSSNG